MKIEQARNLAEQVIERLRPACEKIEIAGSIRREKRDVKDIDIVLLPTSTDALNRVLLSAVQSNGLRFGAKQGLKHKSFWMDGVGTGGADGVPKVELWIAEPGNYGNTLLLRTGDEFWNRAVFVEARFGGLLTNGLYHESGYLWRHKDPSEEPERLSCPTESDYFQQSGIPSTAETARNLRTVLRLKGRC